MKKTLTLPLFLLSIVLGLLAVAAVRSQAAVAASLPADAAEKIGDADLAQIYCLNARWKAGIFLDRIYAARDVLPQTVSQLSALGLTIRLPDFAARRRPGPGRRPPLSRITAGRSAISSTG